MTPAPCPAAGSWAGCPCPGSKSSSDFVPDRKTCLEIISVHGGCCIPGATLWSSEELRLCLHSSRMMLQGLTWVLTCIFTLDLGASSSPSLLMLLSQKQDLIEKKSLEVAGKIICLQRARAVTPGSYTQLASPSAFLLDLIHCSFTAVITLGKYQAGHRSPCRLLIVAGVVPPGW